MHKQTHILYADRMQFIVATMTKEYEKAREIANKILRDEPDNTILQNYLSIFDKETVNKITEKQIHDDTADGTESDTESNSDNNDECGNGSDSDSSCDSTADEDNERTVIEKKTFCRKFVKEKTSYDSSYRYNTGDNVPKFRYNDFRGKIIRVLPIRLSDKISGAK